jgi:hypothetical protein
LEAQGLQMEQAQAEASNDLEDIYNQSCKKFYLTLVAYFSLIIFALQVQ